MLENPATSQLLRLLPAIRRARGYRLYAEDGRRFLDLWQEGGPGMLGAKGTGLGTAVKAAVDKGLAKPFPSIHERRLEKELLLLHPAYRAVRLFPDLGAALAALARAFGAEGLAAAPRDEAARALLADPARRGAADPRARALVLRPFAEALGPALAAGEAATGAAAEALPAALALLPCPAVLAPVPLLFRSEADAAKAGGELLPPLLAIGGRRSLVELRGYGKNYDEALWRRTDRRLKALFERKGPYLYARCRADEYESLFRAALDRGILLSPDHDLPSIVPGDFDDGELKALAGVAR